MSTTPPATGPLDLGAYRWRNRLLLVFTPSPHDWACRQQHSFLGQSHDLLDRDLLVASVYEECEGQLGDRMITSADAAALREQFSIAPNAFAAVLVGKDGGEKQRFDHPVPAHELFAIIDAMPMRQHEQHTSDG